MSEAGNDVGSEGEFSSSECETFQDDVDDLVLRWDDAIEVASSTPRVSLSDQVVRMQEVRQDARALEEPACAEALHVKRKMIDMMDSGIDLFTAFMGESGDDFKQPSDFRRAEYAIAQDLFVDALITLENNETELPRRIHYYVIADTGISVAYVDESGEFVEVEAEYDRVGFDEMPAVYSAIVPEGETTAVRLDNPPYADEEVTCILFVNGIEVVSETAEGYATCEY